VTELDFQSSQLELLTEALRAGPGTPQWREGLSAIESTGGGEVADEYKLLCAARERLASGREYREVRAGPGFTRKVFDAIDQDDASAQPNRALPSANLIAAASALVILMVLAAVTFWVLPRREANTVGGELSATSFLNVRAQSSFESDLGMEWAAFGPVQVEAHGGLHPVITTATANDADTNTFRGGGVMYERSFEGDQSFAAAATIRFAKPGDDVIVQLFVADDRNFDERSATSPHELVWQVRGSEASVWLPDRTAATRGTKFRTSAARERTEVRISIAQNAAAVEMNGRRLWSGPHQLDPAKPRIVGVRFLTQGKAAAKNLPVVESMRVLVP
jgi:hypothetical protein